MKAYLDTILKLPISKQQIGKNNVGEVIATANDITVKIKAFQTEHEGTSNRLERAVIEFSTEKKSFSFQLVELFDQLHTL